MWFEHDLNALFEVVRLTLLVTPIQWVPTPKELGDRVKKSDFTNKRYSRFCWVPSQSYLFQGFFPKYFERENLFFYLEIDKKRESREVSRKRERAERQKPHTACSILRGRYKRRSRSRRFGRLRLPHGWRRFERRRYHRWSISNTGTRLLSKFTLSKVQRSKNMAKIHRLALDLLRIVPY